MLAIELFVCFLWLLNVYLTIISQKKLSEVIRDTKYFSNFVVGNHSDC